MLSRLASRAVQQCRQNAVPLPMVVASQKSSTYKEGPERDLVNFPRPVQREHPGAVRLGFIPDEWFELFYKKTGVSGPYMFGLGLSTFLVSKEFYVLEHEFYNGLSILVMVIFVHNKFGPPLGKYLDKQVAAYEKQLTDFTENQKIAFSEGIKQEKKAQWQLEAHKLLFDAKRENVAVQLEAAYRERMMTAYTEVKRRLDYQVELLNVERRISQKNMVSWITNSVLKSITSTQEQDTLKQCIGDLKALAARA